MGLDVGWFDDPLDWPDEPLGDPLDPLGEPDAAPSSFMCPFGTQYGKEALGYYANQWAESGNPLWSVPGFFAALWTPETYIPTTMVLSNASGYARGMEFAFGRNFRIAPWGNRTGHPLGELPHYHRRGPIDPATGKTQSGGGIGRHRPWEGW